MADTQRTRAAILALFADNAVGNLSAQDLRDFVVTIMEQDFINPGDFWKQPEVSFHTTDKTVRGWVQVSQLITSDISFGRVVRLLATGSGWVPAYASDLAVRGVLGVAGDSYAASASNAVILRRGLVYDSSLSARFTGVIGAYLYLQSTLGSISVTANTNSTHIVGYVEQSAFNDNTSSHWRFEPVWGVVA